MTVFIIISGSCRNKGMSVEDVKQLIAKEAPVGSDKAQVIAFLDSHKIEHSDYSNHPERESDFESSQLNGKRDLVTAYMKANLRDVGAEAWYSFSKWNIQMFFYFDEAGKVLVYTVEGVGTSF